MQYRKHSNKRLRAFIKFLSFLPGRLLDAGAYLIFES